MFILRRNSDFTRDCQAEEHHCACGRSLPLLLSKYFHKYALEDEHVFVTRTFLNYFHWQAAVWVMLRVARRRETYSEALYSP